MPHNLEKSAFHPGEYVAYGPSGVYRVRKSAAGGWWIMAANGSWFARARTLVEIAKLVEA